MRLAFRSALRNLCALQQLIGAKSPKVFGGHGQFPEQGSVCVSLPLVLRMSEGEALCYDAGVFCNPTRVGGTGVPALHPAGCSLSPKSAQFLMQGRGKHPEHHPVTRSHHLFAMLAHEINSLV